MVTARNGIWLIQMDSTKTTNPLKMNFGLELTIFGYVIYGGHLSNNMCAWIIIIIYVRGWDPKSLMATMEKKWREEAML